MIRTFEKRIPVFLAIMAFNFGTAGDISRMYWTEERPSLVRRNKIYEVISMCRTKDNNIILVLDRNECKSNTDYYDETRIIKLDENLEEIWVKSFQSNYSVKCIPALDTGVFIIDNDCLYKFDKNGDLAWETFIRSGIGDAILDMKDTSILVAAGPALGIYKIDMAGNYVDSLDTTGFGTASFVSIDTIANGYYVCDEHKVRKIDRDLNIVREIDVPHGFNRCCTFLFSTADGGFSILSHGYTVGGCNHSIIATKFDSTCTLDSTFCALTKPDATPSLNYAHRYENDTIIALGTEVGADSAFIGKFHHTTGWKFSKVAKWTDSYIRSIIPISSSEMYVLGQTYIKGNGCDGYGWVSLIDSEWRGPPLRLGRNPASGGLKRKSAGSGNVFDLAGRRINENKSNIFMPILGMKAGEEKKVNQIIPLFKYRHERGH